MILSLPITNTPEKFSISLNGTEFVLVSRWNDAPEAGWIVDFYDEDELPLIMNVPLILGANLLSQYAYIAVEGLVYVINEEPDFPVPTLNNLGISSFVLYEVET